MATQIVMDRTGDARHYFDADDTEAVFKAEERFNVLTSVGFTAAVRDAEGEVTVTRSFDSTARNAVLSAARRRLCARYIDALRPRFRGKSKCGRCCYCSSRHSQYGLSCYRKYLPDVGAVSVSFN